jgi:C-terminal processing protease CtpA/Prc
MRIRPRQGVVVTEVMPGSPAAEAGVQEYDVIVAFNGVAVNSSRALQEAVEQSTLGQRRSLTVIRDGNERKLDLIVNRLPSATRSPKRSQLRKAPTAIRSWGSTSPTCRAARPRNLKASKA